MDNKVTSPKYVETKRIIFVLVRAECVNADREE